MCIKEVDLDERTRNWTFHQSECSFEFDRYAHLVQEGQKPDHLSSDWYREMQKDWETHFRHLREAAEK